MAPISAIALSLAISTPAKAVLNYYIYDDGPNVLLEALGSLQLPQKVQDGLINEPVLRSLPPLFSFASTGPSLSLGVFLVESSTTTTFPFNSTYYGSSFTGDPQNGMGFGPLYQSLLGSEIFIIDNFYVSGGPIQTKTIFSSLSLATLGFTTTGEFNSWTLKPADVSDPYTANDTIHWIVGAPVPGPLPVMGAAGGLAASPPSAVLPAPLADRQGPGARHPRVSP